MESLLSCFEYIYVHIFLLLDRLKKQKYVEMYKKKWWPRPKPLALAIRRHT